MNSPNIKLIKCIKRDDNKEVYINTKYISVIYDEGDYVKVCLIAVWYEFNISYNDFIKQINSQK
jgi:hypothetical protein